MFWWRLTCSCCEIVFQKLVMRMEGIIEADRLLMVDSVATSVGQSFGLALLHRCFNFQKMCLLEWQLAEEHTMNWKDLSLGDNFFLFLLFFLSHFLIHQLSLFPFLPRLLRTFTQDISMCKWLSLIWWWTCYARCFSIEIGVHQVQRLNHSWKCSWLDCRQFSLFS